MNDKITMKEMCAILGISRQTFYAWQAKQVPGLPVPQQAFKSTVNVFDRDEVVRFKNSNWFGRD